MQLPKRWTMANRRSRSVRWTRCIALALGLSLSVSWLDAADARQSPASGPVVVLDVPKIVEQVDASVVSIDVATDVERGRGSGIIIDRAGLIVTNFHVIAPGEENTLDFSRADAGPPKLATSITVYLPDGRSLLASVKGFDRATDIAVISVDPGTTPLPEAKWGNSDDLRVGEWVIAIGNPLGLDHTVTLGIISGKGRVGFGGQFDDFLQTDAAINPGNSGGPLVNARGEVVGINTLILEKWSGLSFAIPANIVREIVPELTTKGRVTRGSLGIDSFDTSAPMRKRLNLPPDRAGIVVNKVERGTPAAKAGIRQGDFIVTVDQTPVANKAQFNRIVTRKAPGSKVGITFLRDGKEYSITAEVGSADASPQ